MLVKEAVDWSREELRKGTPSPKIAAKLLREGFTARESQDIINMAKADVGVFSQEDGGLHALELPPEAHESPFRKKKEGPKYKQVNKKVRKTSLAGFVEKEKKFFVFVFILFLFFVFILSLVLGWILFFSDDSGQSIWDPIDPNEEDGLPPSVSVSSSSDWMDFANPEVDCSDNGKNYVSGCNESSYRYFISESEDCPEDYSLYSEVFGGYGEGFLCVSAKDNEENAGFSQPVSVRFDFLEPSSFISTNDSWFLESFSVESSDFDEGSGIENCFYRVLSDGLVIVDWAERECNSSIDVPVGSGGCLESGDDSCVVQAYAVDKAGNTGETVSASFNVGEPGECDDGEYEQCTWLVGSCSEGYRYCEDGSWENCDFSEVDGFESTEVSCGDGLDNDCDGLADGMDSDCGDSCSNEGSCSSLGDYYCKASTNMLYECGECDDDGCLDLCDSQDCSDCSCECGDYTDGDEDDVSGGCGDEIDNDCDGDTDEDDIDCEGCDNDCSLSDESICDGNLEYFCGDCDSDSCLEECSSDCSQSNGTHCVCACGNYTIGSEDEISCSDGLDNDCDGLIDCDGSGDPDCDCCSNDCSLGETQCQGNSLYSCGDCDPDYCLEWCSPTDCSQGYGTCDCSCGDYTTGNEDEIRCDDGIDNDCDGDTDDDDSDCGSSCTDDCTGGTQCIGNSLYTCGDCDSDDCDEWCSPVDCSQGSGTCACSCGDYTTDTEDEVSCSDGLDNDCDGLTDCDGSGDPDCQCDWWDVSWDRRAPVTVSYSGSSLSDYAVKVGVDYRSGMESDFDDIRFVDSDGSTELDYWRESYDSSSDAIFWVEVPHVPNGGKDIWLYYDNPGTPSASDGEDTFPAFFYDMSYDPTSDWDYTYYYDDSTHRCMSLVNDFNGGTNIEKGRFRYKHKFNWLNVINWASQSRFGLTDGSDSSNSKTGTLFSGSNIYWSESFNRDSGAWEPHPACFFHVGNDGGGSSTSRSQVPGYSEGNTYISEQRWNGDEGEIVIWTSSYSEVETQTLSTDLPTDSTAQFFQWGSHSECGSGEGYDFEYVTGSPDYLRYKITGSHYGCGTYGIEHFFYWMFVSKYASEDPTTSLGSSEQY